METRANYVAVGFFTLLVIAGIFGFIYWVARLDDGGDLVTMNFRIEGAVTGLATGSEVHFNGIKVGRVKRVIFDDNDPRVVYAIASVSADAPVRADTDATIGVQGLSGIAYISLKGGSPGLPLILKQQSGAIPTLSARPSAVSDILETVREVTGRANTTLVSLEKIIEGNRGSVENSIKNVEKFTGALGNNADDLDKMLKNLTTIGTSLAGLGDKLDTTIKGVEGLVAAVKPEDVKAVVANAKSFSEDLRASGKQIDQLTSSARQTMTSIQGVSTQLSASLTRIDKILAAVDEKDVKLTVDEIRQAAKGAREVVASVSSFSKVLDKRSSDVETIITNAKNMSQTLNKSSAKIDQLVTNLNGFLSSEGSKGLASELSTTLAEFRNMAKTLTARVNQISQGLGRFSGSGLRNVDGLVGELRNSVQRIDGVVRKLESNPSGFLLGGGSSQVRTYNGGGRPRR